MSASGAAAADRRRDVQVGDTFWRNRMFFRIVGFNADGEAKIEPVWWNGVPPVAMLREPPSRDETGRVRAEPA